ncbi:MAG: 2Fe-2S iron-sulfur cluster-binding protein [Anaerolineae bacterium]|nr:2Fe-2S iron-sulfur cluster-binding protein [Anaerolineae bacterium]MDW8098730.1 2Fe-2S iron-sulfur cluster-binding protein [Anaerolineae bacterium]
MSQVYPVTLVFPDGREVTLQVDEGTFILDAAAAAGIDLPHTCLQGWCLTCAAQSLDGNAVCVDHSAARRYFPEDAEGGFVLLCTGRPRGACRLATHRAQAMKAYRRQRGRPAPGA